MFLNVLPGLRRSSLLAIGKRGQAGLSRVKPGCFSCDRGLFKGPSLVAAYTESLTTKLN